MAVKGPRHGADNVLGPTVRGLRQDGADPLVAEIGVKDEGLAVVGLTYSESWAGEVELEGLERCVVLLRPSRTEVGRQVLLLEQGVQRRGQLGVLGVEAPVIRERSGTLRRSLMERGASNDKILLPY